MNTHAPTGQAILALLSDGDTRTGRDMASTLNVTPKRVCAAGTRLLARGYVNRNEGCYQITEAGKNVLATDSYQQNGSAKGTLSGLHRNSLRSRAWSLMRMRMWWGLDDLLLTLADGTEKDAEKGIKRYICALFRAGYLIASKREAERYHLVRNTGRLAPAFNTAARTLTDPNTGEVHDVRA